MEIVSSRVLYSNRGDPSPGLPREYACNDGDGLDSGSGPE